MTPRLAHCRPKEPHRGGKYPWQPSSASTSTAVPRFAVRRNRGRRARSGQVRIKVEAVGLNRSEAMFRAGRYPTKPQLPTFIGYEGCGIVEALGTGVTGSQGRRPGLRPAPPPPPPPALSPRRIWPMGDPGDCPGRLPGADPGGPDGSRGRVDLDAVYDRLCDHRGRQCRHWRRRHHSRRFVQREASPRSSSPTGRARSPLPRPAPAPRPMRSAREGAAHVVATEEVDLIEDGDDHHQRQGRAHPPSIPSAVLTWRALAAALAERGILFIYGGLSETATPYPHWHCAFKGRCPCAAGSRPKSGITRTVTRRRRRISSRAWRAGT